MTMLAELELLWFVFGVLVFDGVVANDACPDGWLFNPLHTSCLKPLAQEVTWYDARDHCSSLSSTLVHVDSKDMNDFLKEEVLPMNILVEKYIWISTNDIREEDVYRGIHNRLMTYDAWLSTQPNDASQGGPHTQNCVMHMIPDLEQEDRTCEDNRKYEFVCEWWLRGFSSAFFEPLRIAFYNGSPITNFGYGSSVLYTVPSKITCTALCLRFSFECDAVLYNPGTGTCRFLLLYEVGNSKALTQTDIDALAVDGSVAYDIHG